MKNNTPEERQAELHKAKESMKEWTRQGRMWDYKDMCLRYPHVSTRVAFVKDLLSRHFFVANCPENLDLELADQPSTSAAATVHVPSPVSSGSEASAGTEECTSSTSSDDADSHDPAWQG